MSETKSEELSLREKRKLRHSTVRKAPCIASIFMKNISEDLLLLQKKVL